MLLHLAVQTSRPCLGAQKMEFRSRAVSEAIHEERNVVDFHGSEDMIGETIVALSSGSGRSGVAVIRISGPQAGNASYCAISICKRNIHYTALAIPELVKNHIRAHS